MSNKRIVRKTHITKKRQNSFNLQQNITQSLIPSYNALKDPFLNGFFDSPSHKKILKSTGVIIRSKRLSIKQLQQRLSKESKKEKSKAKSQINQSERKSNGLGVGVEIKELDVILTEERRVGTSETSRRHRKVYVSRPL